MTSGLYKCEAEMINPRIWFVLSKMFILLAAMCKCGQAKIKIYGVSIV